jgi:hypothetical protein
MTFGIAGNVIETARVPVDQKSPKLRHFNV